MIGGIKMILKTAANYNDEGGYIEAWKKATAQQK